MCAQLSHVSPDHFHNRLIHIKLNEHSLTKNVLLVYLCAISILLKTKIKRVCFQSHFYDLMNFT